MTQSSIATTQRLMLATARFSIESKFAGAQALPMLGDDELLQQCRGAFVTLTQESNLRGCIGRIRTSNPLAQTIPAMARAAAFEDPRFPPLQLSELESVVIEISILSEPQVIGSDQIDRITVGRHGLIISNGWRSGVLLPQVASELGWSTTEFLEQTCRKAGLPRDAWRNSKIELFTAEVFRE